jgi:multidrug resistance efflux pump
MAESNPNVRSVLLLKNQDYNNAIAARLSELRNDSARLQVPAHRLVVRNVLRDFDFYRSTRNSIDVLRQEVTKSGEGARGSERLVAELATAKQEASSAKQQVVTLQAALAAASARGGGGGTTVMAPPSGNAKLQIELLRDQVAFAEADCQRQRALDRKPRSKERRQLLESSRKAFIQILQDPATDDLKQSIEQTLGPINVELGREPRFFGLL